MAPVPRPVPGGVLRRLVLLGLLVAVAPVFAPNPAFAKDGGAPAKPPKVDHFHDLYEVHLGGLHVADFALDFTDRKRSFEARLVLESRGLFESLKELRALAQGGGTWSSAKAPLKAARPEGYLRVYRQSDKSGTMEVRYTLGRPPEGFHNGKEDPRVPPELRWGALDPLTTLAVGRRLLRAAKPGDRVLLPVFDGKLRYDFQADVGDSETITVNDMRIRTIPVTLEPIPISGFSEKHARSWEGKTMTLHFTDNGAFRPVKFILNSALGGFVVTYLGTCGETETPCPAPQEKYLEANNHSDE
jgi:hypothetical protein